MKTLLNIAFLIVGVLVLWFAWFGIVVSRLSADELVYYYIHPGHLQVDLGVLPDTYKQELMMGFLRKDGELTIKADFVASGTNLYHVASGMVYDYGNLNKEESGAALEITRYLYKRGVGLDLLDGFGCKAIHLARINRQKEVENILLELGGDADWYSGYQKAKKRQCALDARSINGN